MPSEDLDKMVRWTKMQMQMLLIFFWIFFFKCVHFIHSFYNLGYTEFEFEIDVHPFYDIWSKSFPSENEHSQTDRPIH